jgi:hypothetical protein
VREAKEVENLVATAVDTYGGLHCAFNNVKRTRDFNQQ